MIIKKMALRRDAPVLIQGKIFLDRFREILEEDGANQALDFYHNAKHKFFKTEKQFRFFFLTFKEYTLRNTPPWPLEQLLQYVFDRLVFLLQQQNGEINVALAMTKMLQ